eukprot:gnl/Spiro4/3265_TR1590_c0_g1_i1.p2 gnl/Spiro4/3265_TR1590_c0_g1~~gnl/Spiro4/3265_TR1590_c0_g1_i1.p2  ORF type:complete len:252 (+),score=72.84 gnl/Spiro4/3265_TR1590_c0_g1_i1:43-756(+)
MLSRFSSVMLCVCLVLSVAVALQSCAVPNDCQSSGSPFCANNFCLQCRAASNMANSPGNMCDCPSGQFCTSDPTITGTCVGYGSEVGRPCNPVLTMNPNNIQYGINDQAFCGHAVWNVSSPPVGMPPSRVDWIGACVQSVCRVCATNWTQASFHVRDQVCVRDTPHQNRDNGGSRVCYNNGYIDTYKSQWNQALFGERPDWVFYVLYWVFLLLSVAAFVVNLVRNKIKSLQYRTSKI